MNAIFLFFVSFLLIFGEVNAVSSKDLIDRFHVVTIATYAHPNLAKLEESCKKNNIELDVLAMGRPYPGNAIKFIYMTEYLESLNDDDVVMFVDAFDVLIVADKKKILSKFLKMNVPLLIGAETNCAPHPDLASKYPPAPTPFKYVNTGTFIGYVKNVKAWLKALGPINPAYCDQGLTSHYIVNNPNNNLLVLDYHCELFLPLYGVSIDSVTINVKKKRVNCRITESHPYVIHANGSSFTIWNKIYEHLVQKKMQS
jgi:hypothetical protein